MFCGNNLMRNNKVVVEQVLKSYKENQIGQNSDWFVDYSEGRVNNFIEQLARYRKILPPPHSSSEVTILDIGAAPFVCAEALVALGYRVSAVDLNPDRFENIDKLRCQVVKGNGETPKSLDLNNASFDVVILSHVIEHFRHNLIETLSDIKLLLKPRGCLIIDTPNLLSVKGLYSIFNRGVAYSCAGSLYHEWSKITTLGHMGHVPPVSG